ncbi:MAG TPA: hypothetical protein VFK13_04095 [Gemmatimonadaceae bacterium]|nr:hypothetical protein [Gemmatimonadaceae bacterium]
MSAHGPSLRRVAHTLRPMRWSRERLDAYQAERLRALVRHACERVPYYRRLYDAHGVRPEHIRSVADVARLPIARKEDMRLLDPGELLARGARGDRLTSSWTSGSSGVPFSVRRHWVEQDVLHLFRYRALRSFGLRATDRVASVGLVRTDVGRGSPNKKIVGRTLRAFGLHRRTTVDATASAREIAERICAFAPHVITGYPGALAMAAATMTENDRRSLPARFVSVGAEVLTPSLRARIAEGFGVPVFETYGSLEMNLIAWECAATGALHVADDSVLLEVLVDGRPAEPGERGEVVATNLHAYAMPFIRYRLADVVTRGDRRCACGLPFSVIQGVEGRMIDHLVLPDGRRMLPYEVSHCLVRMDATWVGQYQLVQERLDRVVMRVVPSAEPSPRQVAELRDDASTVLGRDVTLVLELVRELPRDPSGKVRLVRSMVQSNYDGPLSFAGAPAPPSPADGAMSPAISSLAAPPADHAHAGGGYGARVP